MRPLAIFAIFKARHMSDCSSCTRPPCLTIVADILETYRKLVASSKMKLQLLPRPWKFAIEDSDKLVMELSTYISCTLYC
jgi:hypothetical protein